MSAELSTPVFFVGFMGSGKTSVVQYLAEAEGLACVDVDEVIAQEQGKSITQIFEDSGQDAFRALEAEKLAQLAQGAPQLIACGGGIVTNWENVKAMVENGFTIWLTVSPEEASLRVGDDPERPLFTDIESVRELYGDRVPLYDKSADAVIDTTDRDIAEVAGEARDILKEAGILS